MAYYINLIVFWMLGNEYIQHCDSYVMQRYTQKKIKRILFTMNRELYIDAYSKAAMLDYIRKNFENTPGYQIGETLYNVRRKQTEIMQLYRSATKQPKPWNIQQQFDWFTDVHNMYSEIVFMTEMSRDLSALDKTTRKNHFRSDEETEALMEAAKAGSSRRQREGRGPSKSMRRSKQIAHAYRDKLLMAYRSGNVNLLKNLLMKPDNHEEGFASELS